MGTPLICHRCPHVSPPPYSGAAHCTKDGIEVVAHQFTDCPIGLFKAIDKPPQCERCGGAHAVDSCPIPEGMTPEDAQKQVLRGGCCDPPKAE